MLLPLGTPRTEFPTCLTTIGSCSPYFDIHDPKHAQTVNLCLLPTWSRQHAPLSPAKHKKDMQHHPALALVVAPTSSFECLSFVRVPPSLPLHKVVDYNCATS